MTPRTLTAACAQPPFETNRLVGVCEQDSIATTASVRELLPVSVAQMSVNVRKHGGAAASLLHYTWLRGNCLRQPPGAWALCTPAAVPSWLMLYAALLICIWGAETLRWSTGESTHAQGPGNGGCWECGCGATDVRISLMLQTGNYV